MLPHPTSSPLTSSVLKLTALLGVAVALAAAIAATGAWPPAAAAQPASAFRPASLVGAAAARAAAGHSITLDALVIPLAKADPGTRAAAADEKAAKQIAWAMLRKFGWKTTQFRYLDRLWSRESSWNIRAENLYSGAYGIPQAVPGDKMASAGPSWPANARTQIRWGLRYIKSRYGFPRGAWRHEVRYGWY